MPRRGRPAKEPDEVKSATLSIRLRPELRQTLDSAAFHSGRSISEEAETRLLESFADDEIRERLGKFHQLLRAYLQTLARRLGVMAKFEVKDHLEAVNIAFELIILAAFKGALPEERIKQFWLRDIAVLSRQGGEGAANIAIDAFTTLTLAGLASVDPLALSQWIKDEAERPT
jgi:hypothetical protein